MMITTAIHSQARGEVGRNSLRVDFQQEGDRVEVQGRVGSEWVSARGDDATLLGDLNGGPLHIEVRSGQNGRRAYSGSLGRELVSLSETPSSDGSHRISGTVGPKSVFLTRRDEAEGYLFSGTVSDPWGHGSPFVEAHFEAGSPEARPEALVPLLLLNS